MIVKRINLAYGGVDYTLADTDIDELKAQLFHAFESGTPLWLTANQGEGSFRETDLLIAPGISVTVTGIDAA